MSRLARTIGFGFLCVAGSACGSARSVASHPASVANACATPTPAILFAALPRDWVASSGPGYEEIVGFEPPEFLPFVVDVPPGESYRATSPRVLEAELDGIAPREAVLGLEAIGSGSASRVGVFAFGCRNGAWVSIGRVEGEIDSGWDGIYDTEPGITSMELAHIDGVVHDFVHLEITDVCGGHAPFFVRTRLMLLHVADHALLPALDLVLRESVEDGPERDSVFAASRTVTPSPNAGGNPPRLDLHIETEGDDTTTCDTALVFDGRSFVAADPTCASR